MGHNRLYWCIHNLLKFSWKLKNYLNKIKGAYLHVTRNNPATFHKYPIKSLEEVADTLYVDRSLYIHVYVKIHLFTKIFVKLEKSI